MTNMLLLITSKPSRDRSAFSIAGNGIKKKEKLVSQRWGMGCCNLCNEAINNVNRKSNYLKDG